MFWRFLWVIRKNGDLNDCWKDNEKWKWPRSWIWIARWLFGVSNGMWHVPYVRLETGRSGTPCSETNLARISLIVISLIIVFPSQSHNRNKIIPFIIFSFFFTQLMYSFLLRLSTKSSKFGRFIITDLILVQSSLMKTEVLSDLL